MDASMPRDRLAKPMFFLAFAYLVLLAGFFHRYIGAQPWEQLLIVTLLEGLLPVFIIEGLFRVLWLGRGVRRWELGRTLLITLFPPLRMGAPSLIRRGELWLPFAGWRTLDHRLADTLDRVFAAPMILFALAIIPLLVIEFTKAADPNANPWLPFALDLAIGTIWLAFALEFILKVSVARRAVRYMRTHWLDMAIVIIPAAEITLHHLSDTALIGRLLRVTRVFSPQYLARMGQLYRLRGLLMRAWAAALVLGLLSRLLGRDPLKVQLQKLKNQEHEMLEDLAELRARMKEIEGLLAAREESNGEPSAAAESVSTASPAEQLLPVTGSGSFLPHPGEDGDGVGLNNDRQ